MLTEEAVEKAVAEIWQLFKESDARLAEHSAKLEAELVAERKKREAELAELTAERKKREAELAEERAKREAELAAERKKREAELAELTAERKKIEAELATERKLTETQFKETDNKINRLAGLFDTQWGRLIEALVAPDSLRLFQEQGIHVNMSVQRFKAQHNGRTLELDIILQNDRELVVVEVKSTVRVEDVRDFLDDLAEFLIFIPRYKDYHIYGAIAGLEFVEDADKFAYRQGLFVLGVVGQGMIAIKNDPAFKPKDFGQAV